MPGKRRVLVTGAGGRIGVPFAMLNALSNHRCNRLDITGTRRLVGYDPQDDACELYPDTGPLHLREQIPEHDRSDQA